MSVHKLNVAGTILLIASALLFWSCTADTPNTVSNTDEFEAEYVSPGQEIAERLCSACHAVTRTDQSRHPDAPAFRDLSENYPVRDLAIPLADGIVVGHPDMPIFAFEEDEIDALIEYLEQLQLPLRT